MERWLSWSKAHAWKVCEPETVPRVRIPLSPPEKTVNFDTKLAVFSTKSVLRRNKSTIVDEICFADEIAYGG